MSEPPPSRPSLGLLMSVVGVVVLTAFAAWAPVGVRKLVLFAIGYGLCCGAIVLWAGREFGLARRWAMLVTGPLIATGLTAIAYHGHHQLRMEHTAAEAEAKAEQKMAQSILDAAAARDPALTAQLDERGGDRGPTVTDYLALRVRPLGEWPKPWPFVFWGAEVFLACAAGTLFVFRMRSTPLDSVEETA